MPFDRIYLINLDRRIDRLGQFRAKTVNIPSLAQFKRFRAIHGDTVGVPNYYLGGGGAWGCLRSHCAILEEATMDNLTSILVLEDDVCFVPDFESKLTQFLSAVPKDWSMLMIGGQDHQSPQPVSEGVGRSVNTQRTHAYAIRGGAAMRDLYRLWNRCPTHIDHWLPRFQANWPTYQPVPFLCGQDAGPSDISGRLDFTRFWSSNADTDETEFIILDAPRELMESLIRLGIHCGHHRNPVTGADVGLEELHALKWPKERLYEWITMISREATDIQKIPAMWVTGFPSPPGLDSDETRFRFVRVSAQSTGDVIAQLPDLAPEYHRRRAVWCWAGNDPETIEGLRWHGFHNGYWRDSITGLDNGLRRIVELEKWEEFPKYLRAVSAEADQLEKGKVLLAHPKINDHLDRIRNAIERPLVQLNGTYLADIIAQVNAVDPMINLKQKGSGPKGEL
jgi:GR25 family glycosyltransferase involved in LPS biosynthesis